MNIKSHFKLYANFYFVSFFQKQSKTQTLRLNHQKFRFINQSFTLTNPKFYAAYPKILILLLKILAKQTKVTSKQPKRLGCLLVFFYFMIV